MIRVSWSDGGESKGHQDFEDHENLYAHDLVCKMQERGFTVQARRFKDLSEIEEDNEDG